MPAVWHACGARYQVAVRVVVVVLPGHVASLLATWQGLPYVTLGQELQGFRLPVAERSKQAYLSQ